jgi:RNA 2',3'-cyclic 3'-phosphodiesterase
MRLFLATTFPDEVLRDVNQRVAALKPRLPPASWVRPEAQHLTFAFLGEQPPSLVGSLEQPLSSALAAVPRFEGSLRGCGFFPNHRHARVGWIGLQPEQSFAAVARAVREVVAAHGIALDGGEFKPHLTLMRMREGWPPASIELFCRSLKDLQPPPFVVGEVTLFSSELHPKGAIHTPLHSFPLA